MPQIPHIVDGDSVFHQPTVGRRVMPHIYFPAEIQQRYCVAEPLLTVVVHNGDIN